MSKIITDKSNIVAIADAVRSKTGSTEELSEVEEKAMAYDIIVGNLG